jgi:hypothetical protein
MLLLDAHHPRSRQKHGAALAKLRSGFQAQTFCNSSRTASLIRVVLPHFLRSFNE